MGPMWKNESYKEKRARLKKKRKKVVPTAPMSSIQTKYYYLYVICVCRITCFGQNGIKSQVWANSEALVPPTQPWTFPEALLPNLFILSLMHYWFWTWEWLWKGPTGQGCWAFPRSTCGAANRLIHLQCVCHSFVLFWI